MLTEYQIEVFRDVDDNFDEEDIFLDEFLDEIEPWVIEILKGIGCDTAKNVLEIPRQELIKRTDLEEETVDDVIRVLSAEFDSEGDAEKSLKDSEAHESSDQESVSDAETNDEPLN